MTTARAMRATRQRAAVSGLLDRLADFRSAQEIHEELRRVGEGIGLTTVYRTLQTLADAGENIGSVASLRAYDAAVTVRSSQGAISTSPARGNPLSTASTARLAAVPPPAD